MDSLSRENAGITFIHSAPGFVRTNWGTELSPFLRAWVRILQTAFAKPAEDAAEFMCDGLFADEWKGGFRLLSPR